ncbi:MAG: hypothetical protein ABWZ76_10740 [Acidimicrobiales bacterium]
MCARRAARVVGRALLSFGALVVLLVATAEPVAAHDVSSGSVPAPPWLLGYIGAFAVGATAVALRATWPTHRLHRFSSPVGPQRSPGLHLGHAVGLVLFAAVLLVAVVGPDSAAANIAPVTVFVIWWVGLPLLCLLLGDVMRAINPFLAVVGVIGRRGEEDGAGPSWTAAAFLAAFAWFFVAYHQPGSPRSLAVFLVVYALAAVAGGGLWGRRWLVTGEGFGALSAAVALLSPRGTRTGPPPGVAALMTVWIGSTAFDAFTSTPFWVDVLGTSRGWERTLLNTVGLVWLTAIVAGVHLLALRVAERRPPATREPETAAERPRASLAGPMGVALVPIGVGWFLAHDLTLLLFEGQNFISLLSDPIGKGWNLFGTITHTVDFDIVQAAWVPWAQILLLIVGHTAAVVIAHDTALAVVRRRLAMRSTWCVAAASAVSVSAAALLVLD